MHNFRKLKVYDRALSLTTSIWRATESFPQTEIFGLTSQFRRAGYSIVLNLAEGSGNRTSREFARYVEFSIRSGYECFACIDIAKNLHFLPPQECEKLEKEVDEVIAMLVGLQKTLTRRAI